MTTYPFPKLSRWRRLVRWFDRDFHRYAANLLLLMLVLYALAASFQWHDLTGH